MSCEHEFTHVTHIEHSYYGADENKPTTKEVVTVYCKKCGKVALNMGYVTKEADGAE